MAWDIGPLGLVHVLVETEVNVAGRYDPDYVAGVGLSGGILRQMTRSWKALLAVRQMEGVMGDTDRGREFSAILRQGISSPAAGRSFWTPAGPFLPDFITTKGNSP
jgi:hypothetical protein